MFRENCRRYWIPGRNIAVDEIMARFFGRSIYTTKIPNKPIKKGYKIWALCDRRYLFNFLFYLYISKTIELLNSVNLFNLKEKTKSKEKENLINI